MFQRIKVLYQKNRGLAYLLAGWIIVKWSLGIFFGAWLIRHDLAYLLFLPGLVVLSYFIVKKIRRRNESGKVIPS